VLDPDFDRLDECREAPSSKPTICQLFEPSLDQVEPWTRGGRGVQPDHRHGHDVTTPKSAVAAA